MRHCTVLLVMALCACSREKTLGEQAVEAMSDPQFAQPAPAPKSPAETMPRYYKPGGTAEDFARAKAGCTVVADGDVGSFIWQNCMRAEGWMLVRVPKIPPPSGK